MTLLVKKHNLEDDPKAIPNYQFDEIVVVCVSLLNSQLLRLVIFNNIQIHR